MCSIECMYNVHTALTSHWWLGDRKFAKISPAHRFSSCAYPFNVLAQFAHKFLCLFAILTVLPFVAGPNGQSRQQQVSLWTPELHFIQRERGEEGSSRRKG